MKNKIAVVTGGAHGIGFSVITELINRGAYVACWDNSPEIAVSMKSFGDKVLPINCDISDFESVEKAYQQTRKELGIPQIVINSAGIAGPNKTVEDYNINDWRRVNRVNLDGTFFVNKVCITDMKNENYGRIMNIASIAGKEGNPNASAYSASKAGVIALTKSLGKELAEFNISVNCITPAAAKTRIFDQMSEDHISYMLSKIPRGRFLDVKEAAKMIVWAVSDENSFTTGGVFDLSGGRATY